MTYITRACKKENALLHIYALATNWCEISQPPAVSAMQKTGPMTWPLANQYGVASCLPIVKTTLSRNPTAIRNYRLSVNNSLTTARNYKLSVYNSLTTDYNV